MNRGQGCCLVAVCFIVLMGQIDWTFGQNPLVNHYTIHGELCSDYCGTHGHNYSWCKTKTSWDYCSISENTDYYGNTCLDDHPCGKYGQSYFWCKTKSGSWGYCGKVEPKKHLYVSSTYQKICIDDCLYEKTSEGFRCNTEQGPDYCSPSNDVTYKNEPCRSNCKCETHGADYTWCWTDSSTFDRCGVVKSVGCKCSAHLRKKRSNKTDKDIYCEIKDEGNKQVTRFRARHEPSAIADGENYENELSNIISQWRNDYLSNQARSNLVRTENLRIDLQGMINENNQRYYNVQVQVNIPRRSGTSTTLAQVLIPQYTDVPDRYVRRALTYSSENRSRVFIQVSQCSRII